MKARGHKLWRRLAVLQISACGECLHLGLASRRKTAPQSILRHRAGLQKLHKIMWPASLLAHAAELEAAERLTPDHGATDLAV